MSLKAILEKNEANSITIVLSNNPDNGKLDAKVNLEMFKGIYTPTMHEALYPSLRAYLLAEGLEFQGLTVVAHDND